MIGDWVFIISVWTIPLLLAITLHEAAHGFAASLLGDDTALRQGRVSANPLRHIDPFGTVILPGLLLFAGGVLFGWAKPVPVNFSRLRPRRLGMVLVALAGPGTNILLALLAAMAMHLLVALPESVQSWSYFNLRNLVQINLILAVFNMLPLPPLDGGRVAVGLLPLWLARPLARLEPFGILILLGLLFLVPVLGRQFGLDWNIFYWIVGGPVTFLQDVIAKMAGL